MELADVLSAQLLGYAAVFARLGSAMIFMPGFGDANVPVRHRLFLALVLSAALYPATGVGPVSDDRPAALAMLLGVEIALGIWIGTVARILFSALQFAGYQVGLMSGLANAFAPSIGAFEGATTLASALLVAATALIFVTDLHHLIIRALLMSYQVFPVGRLMPGDLADQIARAASASFYIGMGLANRMMATLPVFFVAGPLLIAGSMALLVVAAPVMLRGFLDAFADWLGRLVF